MAVIALVGSDLALLEGLAQSLAGHRVLLASDAADVPDRFAGEPPLVAVVDRAFAHTATRIPLAPGGAIVLFRAAGAPAPAPPAGVQRLVIADLVLPLERARLVALVQSVEDRARRPGRSTPPLGAPEQQSGH